jgi:hypothetical protein
MGDILSAETVAYPVQQLSREDKTIIMANRFLVALIVAGASICGHGSGYAQTSTWKIDPAHSSVNFEISHLAISEVHSSSTNVSGVVELNDKDLTKSSVEATIDTEVMAVDLITPAKEQSVGSRSIQCNRRPSLWVSVRPSGQNRIFWGLLPDRR